MGLQGGFGVQTVTEQFTPTAQYLSEYLGQAVNVKAYAEDSQLMAAINSGAVDLFYSGPSFFTCQQAITEVRPLLSLVDNLQGQQLTVQGAAVYTKAGSNITTFQDLRGKIVSLGDLTQVTGCLAQWDTVQTAGIDLFTDTKALFFATSQPQVLMDVAEGVADAGFAGPASFYSQVSAGAFPESFFNVLEGRLEEGYPYPISAPLYPTALLSATTAIDLNTSNALLEALLSIDPDTPPAVAGQYYGWTAVADYVPIIELQRALNIYRTDSSDRPYCRDVSDVYRSVTCPPGFQLNAKVPVQDSCAVAGITCPDDHRCVCNPCVSIPKAMQIGSLTVGQFAPILICSVLIPIFILLVWLRRRRLRVDYIPFIDLTFDQHRVLGKGRQGLVLKAQYKHDTVAVKRAAPRSTGGWSIFDLHTLDSSAPLEPLEPQPCATLLQHQCVVAFQWLAACLGFMTRRNRQALRMKQATAMRHPNLLQVHGVSSGADGNEALVVYQFAEAGTLFELLRNPSVDINLPFALTLARDIALGLQYLHTRDSPIVGKNLRSHHILIGAGFKCMLGISFNPHPEGGRSSLFQAPEILTGHPSSKASDVYAFAMLLYEIIHRKDAFDGEDLQAVIKAIKDASAEEAKRPVLNTSIPEEVELLFQTCWSESPGQRPSFDEILVVLNKYAYESISQQLISQQQQANSLLNRIFPEHTVKALQEGRRPSDREFDMVTIYFSDIKGFTAMASAKKPRLVMDMLDTLYSLFDGLCKKHGLMKIETRGDEYMAVAGLHGEPDHAAKVARFALDATSQAHQVAAPGTTDDFISIRSGFHSGPITTGVIGTEKPRFCLFGDTCNCASRMESTGEPNRIQMTKVSATLVRQQDPSLACRIRRRPGDVEVKGKAPMQTYWLYTDEDLQYRRGRRRGSECHSEASRRSDDDKMSQDGDSDRRKSLELHMET